MKDHNEETGASRLAKRIAGYSLAAGAFLAGAPEADAGVIHSGPISKSFGGTFGPLGVTFEGNAQDAMFYGGGDATNGGFLVYGKYGFGVDVYYLGGLPTGDQQQFAPFVNPRSPSELVPPGSFASFGIFYERTNGQPLGAWDSGDPQYFGFTFLRESDGAQLFGWGLVRGLGVTDGELLGWAFDDSGAAIHIGPIPEPGALGLFALGATGLALYRKRRKKNAS